MSNWLVGLTGLIYAYVAAEQFWKGNVPMGICYTGYAFANVGLLMVVK